MAEPKVEVVISGIGGLFPESENLDELKTILFNKENAVTSDSRKWTPGGTYLLFISKRYIFECFKLRIENIY